MPHYRRRSMANYSLESGKMGTENENEERHPYEVIADRADALGLEDDERDDYIERRMQRAGYKRGTGEWVSISEDDDDDDGHDDDDQPVTRGDIRRMNKDRRKTQQSYTPPRRKREADGGKTGGEGNTKKRSDPWW